MKIRGLLAGLVAAVVLNGCTGSITAPQTPSEVILLDDTTQADSTAIGGTTGGGGSGGGGAMGSGN